MKMTKLRNINKSVRYVASVMLITGSQLVCGRDSLNSTGNLSHSSDGDDKRSLGRLRAAIRSTDLSGVSYLFAKSKKVKVTRGSSGQSAVFVGVVSAELLRTRISAVALHPIQRYNPREAIVAIMQTHEVQGKLRGLNLERPLTALGGVMQEPITRLPHLPTSLKNVTMEEAMDRVARTFAGVIIYGEWRDANGTRLFDVDFARPTAFGL